MGGIAADALIDFQWTRVPNAEYYVLTVWDGPTSGPPVLNMTTVNDHVVGNINYAGDLITWRVDAYRAEYNVPASGASATFTSVRWTSELDGPADGATVDYPSMGLELGDRPLPDQGGAVLADQHIGDTAPLARRVRPRHVAMGYRSGRRREPDRDEAPDADGAYLHAHVEPGHAGVDEPRRRLDSPAP